MSISNIDSINLLWAKSDPFHPVWHHLLDVAAVCKCLMKRFGSVDPIPDEWVLYLVALHDIGKVSRYFQGKSKEHAAKLPKEYDIPEEIKCVGFRHEAVSADWIRDHLMQTHYWPREIAAMAASSCRGHHGDFKSKNKHHDESEDSSFTLWEGLKSHTAQIVYKTLKVPSWKPLEEINLSDAGINLVGLTVFSDWIASNSDIFPFETIDPELQLSPDDYYIKSLSLAEQVINRLGMQPLCKIEYPQNPPLFSEIWPECTSLRPSQKAIQKVVLAGILPGLAIIEAPMGEGKTEVAIYLAEYWNSILNRSGAYIALPTQATSNQMHERYAKYIHENRKADEPLLVHGMAWLIDPVIPDKASETWGEDDEIEQKKDRSLSRDWFSNAKRALLAPEGVGTVDQALMGALNVKHGFLRLFGLSSKVLIIDECHAYDTYMTTIMERLLAWCHALHIPVILLSATLSRKQKVRLLEAYGKNDRKRIEETSCLNDYPLLTFVPWEGEISTYTVDKDDIIEKVYQVKRLEGALGKPEIIAAKAFTLIENGGCLCILCNTVTGAQKTYESIKPLLPDPEIQLYLFHARYRAQIRNTIETGIKSLFAKDNGKLNKKRPIKAIVVATQVIEQSLDIDFDVMISDIAPIDLLLQRLGRVHRHLGNPRYGHPDPAIYVAMPDKGSYSYGSTQSVYSKEILMKTDALLESLTSEKISLPNDFRPLIEGCYGESDPSWQNLPQDILQKAIQDHDEDQKMEKSLAKRHLIPEPLISDFTYGSVDKAVDEADDGEDSSYMRAKTRLGDDSVSVILIDNPELFHKAANDEKLPKHLRQELFKNKVNIAKRMAVGVEPQEGYEAIIHDPLALPGQKLILIRDGKWQGIRKTKDGDMKIAIVDHTELGIVYEEEKR